MAASSQIVQTKGIFHGLPILPDGQEATNLTAIVTGATGLSGYHMVKVLAASPRWSKIYCLSCRPAPGGFFSGLGSVTSRVEHLQVDFLEEPSQIAGRLKDKIDHVQVHCCIEMFLI